MMTVAKGYVEVAERALLASNAALQKSIHEKAAFLSYHAFESIGGAFCAHRGVTYPRGHSNKIGRFVTESKKEKFSGLVGYLAITYGSLRNALLYPALVPGGSVILPKSVLSASQADRLIGQTDSLVKKIKPNV